MKKTKLDITWEQYAAFWGIELDEFGCNLQQEQIADRYEFKKEDEK